MIKFLIRMAKGIAVMVVLFIILFTLGAIMTLIGSYPFVAVVIFLFIAGYMFGGLVE